jgi:hypothetical protein
MRGKHGGRGGDLVDQGLVELGELVDAGEEEEGEHSGHEGGPDGSEVGRISRALGDGVRRGVDLVLMGGVLHLLQGLPEIHLNHGVEPGGNTGLQCADNGVQVMLTAEEGANGQEGGQKVRRRGDLRRATRMRVW